MISMLVTLAFAAQPDHVRKAELVADDICRVTVAVADGHTVRTRDYTPEDEQFRYCTKAAADLLLVDKTAIGTAIATGTAIVLDATSDSSSRRGTPVSR